METAHLQELIQLEEGYWWHVAKRRWATELLSQHAPPPTSIVEGGIGAAGNLLQWQSLGYRVTGLDCMPEAISNAQSRGLNSVYQHDLHLPWPVENHSASAVVLLDVLEHLQEPVVALQHAKQCLSPQGRLIFTVPAYPWLFSDWDQRLGHYRRYTADMLREQADQAGLHIQSLTHWNAFSLPVACFLRLWSRLRKTSRRAEFPRVNQMMNRLLIATASIERRLSQSISVPCGLSLVGVMSR